jgi:hypothetical protein
VNFSAGSKQPAFGSLIGLCLDGAECGIALQAFDRAPSVHEFEMLEKPSVAKALVLFIHIG